MGKLETCWRCDIHLYWANTASEVTVMSQNYNYNVGWHCLALLMPNTFIKLTSPNNWKHGPNDYIKPKKRLLIKSITICKYK